MDEPEDFRPGVCYFGHACCSAGTTLHEHWTDPEVCALCNWMQDDEDLDA